MHRFEKNHFNTFGKHQRQHQEWPICISNMYRYIDVPILMYRYIDVPVHWCTGIDALIEVGMTFETGIGNWGHTLCVTIILIGNTKSKCYEILLYRPPLKCDHLLKDNAAILEQKISQKNARSVLILSFLRGAVKRSNRNFLERCWELWHLN